MTYTVHGELRDVWMCHCEHCRRTSGHHMAATRARAADLTVESDESLRWYSHQPGVSYGFCTTCGSSLFWKAEDKSEAISICAGTLDHPTGLTTAGVLFASEAADYITVHPDVPTHDGDHG